MNLSKINEEIRAEQLELHVIMPKFQFFFFAFLFTCKIITMKNVKMEMQTIEMDGKERKSES